MRTRTPFLLLLGLALAGAGAVWFLARSNSSTRASLSIDPTGAVVYTLGAPEAPLEVWVGSDYQCPDCRRYEIDELPAIAERFIATGKVRWRYLLFALPGHAEAGPATHAMACAIDQGDRAAAAMHEGLFAAQAEWSRSPDHLAVFRRVANAGGLDLTTYDECMASNRHADQVAGSWREAQRVGIPGTPTVVLFERFYVGGLTANQLERLLNRPPDQR